MSRKPILDSDAGPMRYMTRHERAELDAMLPVLPRMVVIGNTILTEADAHEIARRAAQRQAAQR